MTALPSIPAVRARRTALSLAWGVALLPFAGAAAFAAELLVPKEEARVDAGARAALAAARHHAEQHCALPAVARA